MIGDRNFGVNDLFKTDDKSVFTDAEELSFL